MKELFHIKRVSLLTFSVLFGLLITVTSAIAKPWSFGIISDTQWSKPDDGKNPNTCAADIIRQIDQQFINAGVKLVIAVGDTVEVGSKTSIDTRALYAQDLYNAGIGFYPLRGNHEAAEDPNYLLSGIEFQYAFPQIGTGLNNNTPSDITSSIIPEKDLLNNRPSKKKGLPFWVGHNFSAPTDVNLANNSISYSFDYYNARFILLDQFDVTGNYNNSTIPAQQTWINKRLSDFSRPEHVFVFSHKNLLGASHKDNMFGGKVHKSDPGDGSGVDISTLDPYSLAALQAKQNAQDKFITSLADNNVRFCFFGHDHSHYHSIVKAPLTHGKSVHQLITQSDSSKFYTPRKPWSGNDLPVSQDLYRIGYYIVTVDGPRVTVDYYGSNQTFPRAFSTTPALNFVKLDSFGYSLNGKEFLILHGDSYTIVRDSFRGTDAKILSGANTSRAKYNTGRLFVKSVNTGWISRTGTNHTIYYSDYKLPMDFKEINKASVKAKHRASLASNVLTLWGMADLGRIKTVPYTLSISYDPFRAGINPTKSGNNPNVQQIKLDRSKFVLGTRDDDGNWVNAIDRNFGGTKKFVLGPWNPSYALGTYGVDQSTETAWAVINYNGDFAVVGTSGS